MNVLMSGSSGFVGQIIFKLLKEKNLGVYTLQRINPKTETLEGQFTWENLDDGKIGLMDIFIHLAGKAHDVKNVSNANEYFEVNTELTKRIFDVFLKSKASTFIFMSSVKAVADKLEGVLTEDIVPDPQTAYGQSKLKAEKYILSKVLPPGKRVFILRPCMIHGPGNKGNLNLLYKFVNKGIPYPLVAYENERSFLSVDNLSFIIGELIVDGTIPGGIYNLADDVPLSTNKVISIIAKANKTKIYLWKIKPGVINFLAKIGDKLHFQFNSERLRKLTESYVVSNEKIKKALKITHLPLSSEEGLTITIQSFRSI